MKIAVIGAGNMGTAFSSAFVTKGLVQAEDILLVEPREDAHESLKEQGFSWIRPKVTAEVGQCELIILAVKPQDFHALSVLLKNFVSDGQIILSIMAGIDVRSISSLLGCSKVVRCMPNTPAKLGVGITGFYTVGIGMQEAGTIKKLLEATGKAIQLEQESLLNAVTAISGSGPAYFYYFLRAMVDAGVAIGVPEHMAKELACETMLGAYHLVANSNSGFDELIKSVASKGGTTEAALSTFDTFKVGVGIRNGVVNAEQRARELSQMIAGK